MKDKGSCSSGVDSLHFNLATYQCAQNSDQSIEVKQLIKVFETLATWVLLSGSSNGREYFYFALALVASA